VRNKILLTVFVFVMVGGASFSFFRYMTPAEEIKLLKDFCFGSISFIGILISIFLPVTVISREMEDLTVYVILSKPVKRGAFIFAKYCGIMLTLLAMTGIMTALFLGLLYLREGIVDLAILKSIILLLCKFSVVSAVSLFCAIMTTTHVLAALISFFVYVLGHLIDNLSDLIEHVEVPLTSVILSSAVKLLPNLSGFDISDAIVVGTYISRGYIVKMAAYGAVYTAAVLALTVLCFRKKQL
jgi:ABC-type transport system involved in multi-copper enzyme maturation permease subunit